MNNAAQPNYVVLFADVTGSTRLYDTLGDAAAKQLITGLQARVARTIEDMGGHVHEIVGDEVMAWFDDVPTAVTAACRIQESTTQYKDEHKQPLAMRIGMHCGPVIIDGSRMFGDTINLAARMAGIAQGGQIITTADVTTQLPDSMNDLVRCFDRVKVKGKQAPVVVYDLLWQPKDLTTLHVADPEAQTGRMQASTLCLDGQGLSHRLMPGDKPCVIGRGEGCDLIVVWTSVSRCHATIEFNHGHFVLSDTSTNGTHVITDSGETLYLRRESMPLWGHGRIALGAPVDESTLHLLNFRCE